MADHMHIVPRFYLRRFAVADRVMMVLTDSGDVLRPTVRDAAVRSGIYKRERPDGSTSYDIETVSIHGIEDDAAPVLRDVGARWPLSGDDKLKLALFVGLQLVRGPRWFEWDEAFIVSNVDRYRREVGFSPPDDRPEVTEEEVYRANLEHLQSSTQQLMSMLRVAALAGSVIGSMTWALVEFDRPRLATSDHPVVLWPIDGQGRRPAHAEAGKLGILNVLEVRLPLAADLALLATWSDRPDLPSPISGQATHADNLNAFTVAGAEKQWFFKPDSRRPRLIEQRWVPLSPELMQGYSSRFAQQSQIRQKVGEDLNGRRGSKVPRAEIHHLAQSPA